LIVLTGETEGNVDGVCWKRERCGLFDQICPKWFCLLFRSNNTISTLYWTSL